MNQTFSTATLEGKLTILTLLKEERSPISFHFKSEAHKYFKENYPDIYGSPEKGSHIVSATDELYLTGKILDNIRRPIEGPSVKVLKLEHFSTDAERYNDSCYRAFRPPIWPNGVELEVPLDLIEGISISKLDIK